WVLGRGGLWSASFGGVGGMEVFLPEGNRARRHGVAGARELSRSHPARLARIRKAGGDRADICVAVSVIEVIDGDVAVHQHGLLDHPLPEDAGEEVDVLLRAAGAQRDV